MIAHSVPAGVIYRAPEMLADPHFAAREALVEIETPRWGKVTMQNSFPRLSDTPGSVRAPRRRASARTTTPFSAVCSGYPGKNAPRSPAMA